MTEIGPELPGVKKFRRHFSILTRPPSWPEQQAKDKQEAIKMYCQNRLLDGSQ